MDKDIVKTWVANGTVLGAVTLAESELVLKCMLLLVTILYTLLKCWRLWKGRDDTDFKTK